jgi:hypothetical protein
MGYLLFAILYLLFDGPYTVTNLSTLGGLQVTGLEYNQGAEIVSIIILAVFFAYPSVETFMAARQIRNRFVGRNIWALGISWIVIGTELFVFNGYLINQGIDLREIGYLVSAVAFFVSIVIFRRVSVLEEFFVAKKLSGVGSSFSSSNPFSSRIVTTPAAATAKGKSAAAIIIDDEEDLKISNLIGRSNAILLEVDPSMSYEELVRDFAIESSSNGYSVFAFTANGSPIHRIISSLSEVRMYVGSSDISYPKPTNQPNTILVPVYDAAIMLDIFDTIASNSSPEAKAAMIFDNLSDLVLITGFESSFKFLKKTIEILNDSNLAVVFLLISGTLESRTLNTIRSLFARHLAFDSSGLKITR